MADEPGMPKTEEEWRQKLTPEQYRVLRERGTEPPFAGKYTHAKEKGMYRCAACGEELFSSNAKFDSGTGWPSFTEPANRANVELREDLSGGPPSPDGFGRASMRRVEVVCAHCGSHLGHVFDDGPADRGGKRYCINSCALELETATQIKPVLVYDGECEFCTFWARRWQKRTADAIAYAPFQSAAERFPHIPASDFAAAVKLVMPDGRVYSGAEAVFRALAAAGRWRWLLWGYERLPGFRSVSEAIYRFVASHRPLLYPISRALFGGER